MAVTESVSTEQGTVAFDIDGREMARVLGNAVLFAGKNANRPLLRCLKVDVADGEITVESTDSYVLYRESVGTIDRKVTGEGSFLLMREDAETVARELKRDKSPMSVAVTVDARTVTFTRAGWTFSGVTYDGDFPNTGQLWPKDHQGIGEDEAVGLGAYHFARMAKVVPGDVGVPKDSGNVLKFTFSGPLKPATVKIGSDIDLLVMPCKLT